MFVANMQDFDYIFFPYDVLKGNQIMARTYSFYACQITVRTRFEEEEQLRWISSFMWVSVRLEDKLYAVPGVQALTAMRPVLDIKREDPEAKIYPEYQVTDAIKKSFVSKLSIVLVPRVEGQIAPDYGPYYKTTLVVSGDFELEPYITDSLEPFVWMLGTPPVPYISKPGSISTIGGRKNKRIY